MAERREAGGGADVPDGEGVNFPVPAENFVDKRERVCYDVMRVQETAPSCGEMSEWLKEPVLKTGGAQVPVGSNPTLSANFLKVNPDLRKYPSGRRGSPAKGVGWIKPARGFKSLLPRQRRPWNCNGSRVFSLFFPSFFPYHALIASMAQAVKAGIVRADTASGFLELLADREMGRVSAKKGLCRYRQRP